MRKSLFVAAVALASVIALVSCGGGGGGSSSAPFIFAELDSQPTGSTLAGFQNATAFVLDDNTGSPIPNAAVSINSVAMPYNAFNGDYEGNVDVLPGSSVTLNVTVGGRTYTATATQFSTYPTISSPVSGATWTTNVDNTVRWAGGGAATANTTYGLGVLDPLDPNGFLLWPLNGYIQDVPVGTNSWTIPANQLSPGNPLVLVGIWKVVSIPNAAAFSEFALGGFNYVSVTVTN